MKQQPIKIYFSGLCLILFSACTSNPLKGTWQYDGGVYNGKPQRASTEFLMQRTYTNDSYQAFMLEGNAEPKLYNSGIFELKQDSILITSKFSSSPSQNTDVTIAYKYRIEQEKLITNGILPNGMVVEEHWKKVK